MKRKNQQHRYEVCKDCGKKWNISTMQEIPLGGYLCPWCAAKYRPPHQQVTSKLQASYK